MKANLTAGLSGVLFAAGLALSGMTQPSKVLGFLDVGGNWDPSLALVMGGALAVNIVFWRVIARRARPLFGPSFQIPEAKDIDARLVVGSAIFGVGWGLAGYCPGPALVSCATGGLGALVMTAGMVVGMLGYHAVQLALPPSSATEDDAPARAKAV